MCKVGTCASKRRRIQAKRRKSCLLPIGNNILARLLAQHHRRDDRERAWHYRESTGIHHPQSLHATHAELGVEHSKGIAISANGTRRRGVVRIGLQLDVLGLRGVGAVGSLAQLARAGVEFFEGSDRVASGKPGFAEDIDGLDELGNVGIALVLEEPEVDVGRVLGVCGAEVDRP